MPTTRTTTKKKTQLTLTRDQVRARDEILDWISSPNAEPFFALGGAAGTGKTTLMRLLRDRLEEQNVLWAATTGKAARRLSEVTRAHTRTMHSHLYAAPQEDEDGNLDFGMPCEPPAAGTLVVCDEASMIGPGLYEDMETWAQKGVRFLLVGDPYQLPPVLTRNEEMKWGKDFTVFSLVDGATLTTVVRSTDAIANVAQIIREEARIPKEAVEGYRYRTATYLHAIREWMRDNDDHVLLTWRNAVRMAMNREIRTAFRRRANLPEPGEMVLFCRNGQKVLNGQVAKVTDIIRGPKFDSVQTHNLHTVNGRNIITRVTCGGAKTAMDGGNPPIKNWNKYQAAIREAHADEFSLAASKVPIKWPIPITWAYTLTAHKAQGSEFRRATVFLSEADTRMRFFYKSTVLPDGSKMKFAFRWLYTAITRAQAQVELIVGPDPEG